jgi:hypothetical protein
MIPMVRTTRPRSHLVILCGIFRCTVLVRRLQSIESDENFDEDRTPPVAFVRTPRASTTKETSRLIGSDEKSDEKKAPRKGTMIGGDTCNDKGRKKKGYSWAPSGP